MALQTKGPCMGLKNKNFYLIIKETKMSLRDYSIKTIEEMTEEEIKKWRDEINNDDSYWDMESITDEL